MGRQDQLGNQNGPYWSPVSEHEPATCEALYCQPSTATVVACD